MNDDSLRKSWENIFFFQFVVFEILVFRGPRSFSKYSAKYCQKKPNLVTAKEEEYGLTKNQGLSRNRPIMDSFW